MTDEAAVDITDTEPADDTRQPVTAPAVTEPEVEPDPEEPQPKNREERFRKQLRATEAERDALSERLSRMQRAEVERLASQHLADGADFWRDGTQLDNVLTETGDVDPDKVTELATALVDTHQHWKRTTPPAAPPASSITGNGKISDGAQPQASWTDVLKGLVR